MNSNKHSSAFMWKRVGGASLVILALVAGLLLAEGSNASGLLAYLPFLLILACPLMMIFMMGSMGSMDHPKSASHQHDESVDDALPDMSKLTRDEQVWTLRNELTRTAWRQESLRQDLKRLEHEEHDRTENPDKAATVR